MNTVDEYRIKARGRLATVRLDIDSIRVAAAAAPNWIPAHGLQEECRLALEILENMEERFDRKLTLTLIGPSGAGKSTLLNALAGEDELSAVGIQRPTTRELVVYCRRRSDADNLLRSLGSDAVTVAPRPAAEGLENVILVDTPDMDSTESERFHPVLEKAIAHTDVLVGVLNAENPKRRDSIVFLKRYVDLFPGSALYVVLNRCDRLPEEELKSVVLPDLKRHLEASWGRGVDRTFCTSARNRLKNPGWPEGERPLHAFDEFPQLRQRIQGSLNQGTRFVDVRLERAQQLAEAIRRSAQSGLAGLRDRLLGVRNEIVALEKQAAAAAVSGLKEAGAEMLTGVQAMFYQKLAGRWWGPVGWLTVFWARLLMTGAGMLATLRFGNPVVQIWGLASALLRYRKTRGAVEEAAAGGGLEPVLVRYRYTMLQRWPDIAGRLVELGFTTAVRDIAAALPDEIRLRRHLAAAWKESLETVMERRAAGTSGFLLQLVFNLPTLGLMGRFAYDSVTAFLLGRALAPGYFLHAGVSIVLVWLLSFVLLQVVIRFAGGRNLLKRAFDELLQRIDGEAGDPVSRSIVREIDTVLGLGQV
jgi:GTPase SAR1 family protein